MAEKPGGSLPTRDHGIESPTMSAFISDLADFIYQAEKANGSTSNPLSGCPRASTMAEKPGGSLHPRNYLIESPISAYMNYLANNLASPSHQAEKPNGSIPMGDCPNRDSSTELLLGFSDNPENEFPSPIQPNLGMESAISSEGSREMSLMVQARTMLISTQPYKENEDKEKREAELIGNHVSAQPSTQRNNDYVEEVGIEDKVQKCNNQERTSPERLESAREMTLQEFLARPGVVGESPSGKKKDAPVFGINPIAFTNKNATNQERKSTERLESVGEMTLQEFLARAGVISESSPGKKKDALVLGINPSAFTNKNATLIRFETSTTMDRTHDIFWEQFLSERPGRLDSSNSDEGNEDKEKRNAEVIGNRVSTGPSRPGERNCVEKLEDKVDNLIRQHSICNISSSESDSGESDSDEIKAQSSGTLNEEKCQINCQVPKIGMVFSTEDEAYEFYKKYAGFIGFTVRKGKVQRLSDGKVRKKYFFCSRQGFRLKKQAKKITKYKRKETRVGCKAKIQFTVKNGEWVVSDLNLVHNHEHVIRGQNCIIRSQYLDAHAIIDSVNEDEMTKEAAAAQNVGFQSINCNYFLHHKKTNTLHPGDVQSFINYLNHFQVKDPSFFYTVGVDAENRIQNFFWRDGRSKIDYDYFGDVITLDTTFRMAVYDMICAPFVGVNHHRQYILLGCAFLLDETIESFIWLFETLMRAMGGRQPKTIFTDEHQAMASAIGSILPKTQHRLCKWRICQNATKFLSKIYCQPGFQSNFNKCIFDCQSEKEFESMWLSLLEQYNLHDNQWLQSLYMSREKWSDSFSKKTFSANIESIRSGRGMNDVFNKVTTDVFNKMTSETKILTEFALQYEKEAGRRRREELYEDFHKSESLIDLRSSLMEKQAAKVYTRAVFELFQEVLRESCTLEMEEIASVGTIATYKLREKDPRNESTVGFSFSDRTITCSCQKFDSTGILCLHALKVLNARNIFEIPAQYILKRWTKDAKDGVVDDSGEELIDEIKRPSSLDMCKLTHKAFTLITKCGTIKDTRAIAEHYLNRALEKVEEHLKTITVEDLEVDNEDDASVTNHFPCSETQKMVLNSSCVDLGEISRSRMRSQMKNKCEQKARDIKRKSCDDASTDHQPPVKVARGGIDQESGGGLGYSNCVGRNPLKHANIYQQTETHSASTFHHVDMQLSAPSNKPISRHNR